MERGPFPGMAEAPARLRGKPSWLISKTAIQAHRLLADAMAAAQGRAYHFAVLAALEEFGPGSQVAIGQRCGIDRSDMHAMVNELADQGLVARRHDPGDRRRNIITITAAGKRRLEELDSALNEVQEALLGALSAEERDHLTGLLTRVLTSPPR